MLIRPTADDLIEAIRLNSALWGGAHNPIVEVERSVRRVDAQLAALHFDALHSVSDRAPLRRVVERFPHLRWPRYNGLVRDNSYDATLAAVDIRAPLELPAERSGSGPSGSVLPVWDEDDPFAMVYAATFGDLAGADRYVPGIRERYLNATDAQEVPAAMVARAYRHQRVPLDVTRALIDQTPVYRLSFDSWSGVFAGDATSVADVREYWNLRARGVDAVFWDVSTGGPFQDLVAADVVAAAKIAEADDDEHSRWYPCYRPIGPFVDYFKASFDMSIPENLRAAVEPNLRPVPRHDLVRAEPETLVTLRSTETQQVLAHGDEVTTERSRVVVPLTNPPFKRDEGGSMMQEFVVVLSSYGDRGYRGTMRLPFLPDLNPWYERELEAPFGGVRVEGEAVGIITGRFDPSLDLAPIPLSTLLRRIFERAGIVATPNASGEAARHLISQLGGRNALRVLRIPGVRRLLSRNDAITGLSRQQVLAQIDGGGTLATADPLYVAGQRRATPQDVFDFLLHRQVFLAGLEIGCPQCLHNSIYPPRELGDMLRCPKCSHEFLLAPKLARDQWRFRLSGLLENRAQRTSTLHTESQPEAVPVLLTLLFIGDRAPATGGMIIEPNHDLRGDAIEPCEADFLAVIYGDRHARAGVHCFVGESKGQGHVNEEDLMKLSRVVKVLRESGIDADMAFSTTRASFSDDEIALFRTYYEAQDVVHPSLRRPPLLLNGEDLDAGPYSPRDAFTGRDFLQHGTFGALIEVTRQRYFGDSS